MCEDKNPISEKDRWSCLVQAQLAGLQIQGTQWDSSHPWQGAGREGKKWVQLRSDPAQ